MMPIAFAEKWFWLHWKPKCWSCSQNKRIFPFTTGVTPIWHKDCTGAWHLKLGITF